jgi:hypothetical protein
MPRPWPVAVIPISILCYRNERRNIPRSVTAVKYLIIALRFLVKRFEGAAGISPGEMERRLIVRPRRSGPVTKIEVISVVTNMSGTAVKERRRRTFARGSCGGYASFRWFVPCTCRGGNPHAECFFRSMKVKRNLPELPSREGSAMP